jgi:hypothetical protein
MKKHHFEKKKLAKIMEYETYKILADWYAKNYKPHQPYKLPFDEWVYKNKTHKQYLSKWLEEFVIKYLSIERPDWIVHKVDNRGQAIVRKIELQRPNGYVDVNYKREGFRKNPNQIVGEPDIRCKRPMQVDLYFEVKIGNDRLSSDQIKFIESGFGDVRIIKTVEDFIKEIQSC